MAATVDAFNGSSLHRLVSFVDYGHDAIREHDAVLLRIGNIYVQYNKAKGYNIDADRPNTVTLTEALYDSDVSDSLAALVTGQKYRYSNFLYKGFALVVEICSLNDDSADFDFGMISQYIS